YQYISEYNRVVFNWNSYISYECGFDPQVTETFFRWSFDYRVPIILFLLFDVEILLILPWVYLAKFFFVAGVFFFFLSIILFVLLMISLIFLTATLVLWFILFSFFETTKPNFFDGKLKFSIEGVALISFLGYLLIKSGSMLGQTVRLKVSTIHTLRL